MKTRVDVAPDLEFALRGLKRAGMLGAVVHGMNRGTMLIEGEVIAERLTGKGPFAVALHKLGVRSGRLRQSVNHTAAQVDGEIVSTEIGSNVSYARTHELGFEGKVKVEAHKRTIKTAFGKALPAEKKVSVKAHQRTVKIEARAPFLHGVTENMPLIQREIEREVLKQMKE
jgi:hypothetical protein